MSIMLNGLEIERTLVASTLHLDGPDELDKVSQDQFINPLIIDEYEYGVRVWIGSEYMPTNPELLSQGFSKGFCDIISMAIEEECSWVKFDQDGIVYEGKAEFYEESW